MILLPRIWKKKSTVSKVLLKKQTIPLMLSRKHVNHLLPAEDKQFQQITVEITQYTQCTNIRRAGASLMSWLLQGMFSTHKNATISPNETD